jgi:hypothetical protein
MQTSVDRELEIVVDKPSIIDGQCELLVTKIYGNLEASHRGQKIFGGMSWVPAGRLSVTFPVNGESSLTPEGVSELFSDVMGTLMPSVKVLVSYVDEQDSDF